MICKSSSLNLLMLLLITIFFISCNSDVKAINNSDNNFSTIKKDIKEEENLKNIDIFDSKTKTIHVLVSLCDNKYQGIIPVPKKIGDGQNPENNLYWGAMYGMKTYFKKSKDWKLLKTQKSISSIILERLVFQNVQNRDYYLVADAYDGKYIKDCTVDFLNSSSGKIKDTLHVNKTSIGIYGNSSLVSYIGHDGLMEFNLNDTFKNTDGRTRDFIILACISKKYFTPYLKESKTNPIIWTTGLMAPEAYTLHDALTGYIKGESKELIRERAASAYSKYQNCGKKAAKKLLVCE